MMIDWDDFYVHLNRFFCYLDDTIGRQGFSLLIINTHNYWHYHEWRVSVTTGPNSTLCFMICWLIFAVWVPMGSAELRRLSVALSHSPSGSRASWNWRAKTCSSSNCLCLRDGSYKDTKRSGGGGELLLVFYCFHWFSLCWYAFSLNLYLIIQLSPFFMFMKFLWYIITFRKISSTNNIIIEVCLCIWIPEREVLQSGEKTCASHITMCVCVKKYFP